ncbi:c-1-tetrahydrofolate synthase cytoplasmic [Anaeramoeba ignava]|uniref:C-1-tetrahydrofolate synthase cytoplasmic n=1 Tax=Anaeramoeba ignava TaxID=1746090 RepID=A0A9Q0LHQ3_ANAIG|nr:c-1-tetrahydrofolate synthase cytoplasmic [Anaeramoeba ignava]|eukprot:Anaeramoba_ignava/c20218_g4_i1.p1 GENE.c20218_g4_i1~~c20218_g4_i1.p1  ORF type:complete len:299 (-),score=101.72 c20218_g4_i1:20-916(-)
MTAKIIDGKKIAKIIREEIKQQVSDLFQKTGAKPGLAVVLVGERKDSQVYVREKKKQTVALGMNSFDAILPDTISEEDLMAYVQKYNSNPNIDGILVQLPLPKHINEQRVLDGISETKDVDGFSPLAIGKLAMKGREAMFSACTPLGCIELLDRSGVSIEGKHAVVLGRSNIVGLPVSMLLLHRNATVTIAHSRTKNIGDVVSQADIVIAAIGKANFVQGEWLKKGATVLDVGINAVNDKTKKKGYRLVGDVDFESAKKALGPNGLITPVPGGLGPMTIAMLMKNTLTSFQRKMGLLK